MKRWILIIAVLVAAAVLWQVASRDRMATAADLAPSTGRAPADGPSQEQTAPRAEPASGPADSRQASDRAASPESAVEFPGGEDLAILRRRIENKTLLDERLAGIAPNDIRQVRFLKLRMTRHRVELIAADPVEGRPRRTRATFPLEQLTPGVLVRALTGDDRVVWQDVIQDPTVFRCCHKHAGEARLTGFTGILDVAHFSVRVPDLPMITSVEFFRHPRPVPSLKQVATKENLLGHFELPR